MSSRSAEGVTNADGTANARAEDAKGLAELVDPIVDFSDALVGRARDVAQAADDYVRDHSWAAIGVSALVGLGVGLLLSRRR